MTHLFTEQVGIPLRRYVLWSRLRIAILRVQAGDDLTGAAHGAGFADSAHLTRTTRDMFGLPPSVLSLDPWIDLSKCLRTEICWGADCGHGGAAGLPSFSCVRR
ncbi:MAG TPA: helix-turn-helix domain-containing protein [Mycobacterium sp.]|nr:helix-turn-helix domain-containing protein [Mycolicibacterium vanbaalenii]